MIQNDLSTSYDSSDLDDTVLDDDPLCNNYDDQSIPFEHETLQNCRSD